jgi:hypothetical protein
MSKLPDTIKNLLSLILQDTINLIHHWDYKEKQGNPQSTELIETGFVKVDHFLSKEHCEDLYQQVIAFSEKYPDTVKLDNGTYIDHRSAKTDNGPDKGMIDIYNIDKSINLKIDYEKIERILKPITSCDIYLTSVHAYINRSVEGTRIYHVDNCQPIIYKAFIYLTDVPDHTFGPYSFIKGTDRFSFKVYYNLIRNLFIKKNISTDMPLYNKQKEIIGLGNKGSLIISNQNGIHRGYPQEKNKERVAIVVNYMVVSKLNYIHKTAESTLQKSLKKV